MKSVWTSFVILVVCFSAAQSWALETDQYTHSGIPLTDIGARVSLDFYATLKDIEAGLTGDESPLEIASRFQAVWGRGLPTTRVENWLNRSSEFSDFARYRPTQAESIYNGVPSPVPFTFVYLAPTVNFYGMRFGTDKIGHMIQQGFVYYKIVLKRQAEGRSHELAVQEAVGRGIFEEKTYFGTDLDGVYSNGDLAANYAGLKFYENLTAALTIGTNVIQPVFVKLNGAWRLNGAINPAELLKPFISNHFNEALNPCLYAFAKQKVLRAIAARCGDASLPRADYSRWHGEAYGHSAGRGIQAPVIRVCEISR